MVKATPERRSSRRKKSSIDNLKDNSGKSTDTSRACTVCSTQFPDSDALRKHVLHEHLTTFNKQRFCKFCTELFPSALDFSKHLRDVHLLKLKFCHYCSRAFQDNESLQAHFQKHEKNKLGLHSCSQCPLLFRNIKDIEKHEFDKHDDNSDGVLLVRWYSYLSSLLNINAKTFIHTFNNVCTYKCVKCDINTIERKIYIKHLQNGKCRTYVCDTCFNVYGSEKGLIGHLQKQCPTIEKDDAKSKQRMPCTSCSRFIEKSSYNAHVEKCNKDKLKCKLCDISFSTMSELTSHQSKTHALTALLKTCKYCRHDYVGNNALQKHIKKSHGHEIHLYKYHCVYCDRVFKHPKLLFTHFYSKHRNLDPYTCKICNKKFRVRKKFTIHIKLEHKSVGFVEFDENFHVFFSEQKSFGRNVANRPITEHDYAGSDVDKTSENINVPITTNPETNEESAAENETDNQNDSINDVENKSTDTPKIEQITVTMAPMSDVGSETEPPVQSDIATESDGNTHSETEARKIMPPPTLRRKSKRKRKIPKSLSNSDFDYEMPIQIQDEEDKNQSTDDSEDDKPLSKHIKRKKGKRIGQVSGNKYNYQDKNGKKDPKKDKSKRLVCTICKKYCFSLQNYNRHVSMHFRSDPKQCIKCAKLFKTKEELEVHLKTDHTASKLTNTLQMLLKKRLLMKGSQATPKVPMTNSEKFQATVKKVNVGGHFGQANIIPADPSGGLSVKKYIENFTPDPDTEKPTQSTAVLRVANENQHKPFSIKLTKVKTKPPVAIPSLKKLKMPIKFRAPITNTQKATVKVVYGTPQSQKLPKLNFGSSTFEPPELNSTEQVHFEDSADDFTGTDVHFSDEQVEYADDYQYNDDGQYVEVESQNYAPSDPNLTVIPDVAEEVMLEGTDDQSKVHKSVTIPSTVLSKFEAVQIAQLMPEAPFYKIIKVDDLLKSSKEPEPEVKVELPSGKKLVNVNPLQHLIGDNIPKLERKNKYYKHEPKHKDFQRLIAQGLMNIDKPRVRKPTAGVRKRKIRPPRVSPPKEIMLPDGRKLVSANPLQDLIKQDIHTLPKKYKNYYHEPKHNDFGRLIVEGLMNMDKPKTTRKSLKKTKDDNDSVEQ